MRVARSLLLIIVLSVLPWTVKGQDMTTASDSVFFEYMKSLKNKGNDCYMLSDRLGIRQVLNDYATALEGRKKAGMLDADMERQYVQDTLKLAGDYHYENSDFDEKSYAEAERCFKAYRDYYQENHSTYVGSQGLYIAHLELAQLYYKQGRYEESLDEMTKAEPGFGKYYTYDDEPFDRLSQYAICLARVKQFDAALQKMREVLEYYEDTDSERYGEALRKKAKILMLKEEQTGKKSAKTLAEALQCYKTYFSLKKKDALAHFMGMNSIQREQYWMRVRPFVTDCYRLEDADAGFLYDVTLFAKGLLLQLDSAGGGRQNIHATWQMIQQKLKPDACAIEFVQYEKYGQQQMGALVLKKTGSPVFVKMAAPDSVMQYSISVKDVMVKVSDLIHSIHGANYDSRLPRNKLYSDSTGLNCLIWNPTIIKVIGKASDVWFAPDGYVHQLAIEYMLPQQMTGKRLHRLSSTRSLLEKKVEVKNVQALIVGGVDYQNGKESAMQKGNDSLAFRFIRQQEGMTFKNLPSSKVEAETIAKYRGTGGDTLLIAGRATEQTFRQICSNYSVIHFSTHGYFGAADIPQGTDMKPCSTDHSLSESVLALAGVQHNLTDASFNQDYQDGILSAKEIASLNMSQTELVVLCCCETGLGYVTSDGVYGIQRGLKNAGVKAVVCTLWDIDDDASKFFMINFHRFMTDGYSVYQSFYKARDEMKDYQEGNTGGLIFNPATLSQEQTSVGEDYSEPSYRDAFILIDAIE